MSVSIWWGDFYSPGFPRHLYRVIGHGYCSVRCFPIGDDHGIA